MQIINTYLLIINLLCLILMGIDKFQAIIKKKRIPEITLITLSTLGGLFGTIIGMLIFRHKIRKKKFLLLIPLSIIYIIYYIRII